jgi:hypothetical protein
VERTTAEPTPTPTPVPAVSTVTSVSGGGVEVPWAGVAMTFPEGWRVDVITTPSGYGDVLFALHTEEGDGRCKLSLSDASGYDRLAAFAESDEVLALGGAGAVRFDLILPNPAGTIYDSAYVVVSADAAYQLTCGGSRRTPNHWLSIAQTIEFLPEE